jgi:SAM-dependent methyltransferase
MNKDYGSGGSVSQNQRVTEAPTRGPFEGVWNIIRFNWPFYVAGGGACILSTLLLTLIHWPIALSVMGWIGISGAFYWLLSSLAVSYYVYDASPLYKWNWLCALLPQPPRAWANIHSGFDETSLHLQALFPAEQQQTLDIYDPQAMTEPSIARARALIAPPVPAIPANFTALPLSDNSLDAVFLIFAAHEIREPAGRLRFFQELKRVTLPGASVVIVEHLRDVANFMAFGPGFWHFMSRREWRRLAIESGFTIDRELRITPFVTVFILENAPDQGLTSIGEAP